MLTITEFDEKLTLDNYIKEQKSKGFNDNEIKEQLLEAGWDINIVNDMLKSNQNKTESFIETNDSTALFSKYAKYLTEDENVTTSYKIGFFKILVTNMRLIIIRKFPRTIAKIDYDDIELVEYYTDIEWKQLAYGIIFGLVAFSIYFFDQLITPKLAKTIIFLTPYLKKEFFIGLNVISFSLLIALAILSIKYIITFYHSTQGKLRIMPKREGPREITTKLTKEVQEFINFIELKKKELKNTV